MWTHPHSLMWRTISSMQNRQKWRISDNYLRLCLLIRITGIVDMKKNYWNYCLYCITVKVSREQVMFVQRMIVKRTKDFAFEKFFFFVSPETISKYCILLFDLPTFHHSISEVSSFIRTLFSFGILHIDRKLEMMTLCSTKEIFKWNKCKWGVEPELGDANYIWIKEKIGRCLNVD